MFMEHLALTYKCHSSIGNSLDLNSMIKEVLTTFVEETNAINGFFYLIDENNKLYKYLSYDESFECNNDVLDKQIKDLSFVRTFISDEKKILLLPLKKGIFFIVFQNSNINFEFIISMFQDLIVKLNISIDACLNVQKMKSKNKMLNLLANELKEQQKQLIESDKYKNNFLANMSHELKTPLNSIIVISSIMGKNKNQKLDEEQVKNMKIINSCGNDLLILINDILDISKIEAGEIAINLSKINIFELVDNLISEMLPLANEKGLELNFDSLLEGLSFLSDAHRIKQIIKNFKGRYILGLSATPNRKDDLQPILYQQLGEISYEYKKKRTHNNKLQIVRTEFQSSADNYATIINELCADENRNNLIIEAIKLNIQRKILVLTDRIEHINILESLLQKENLDYVCVHGSLNKKEQVENMALVHKKSLIIATTSYFGEGIDFPHLNTIMFVTPISYYGRLVQYLGRIGRGNQECLAIDFLDSKNAMLNSAYKKRLEGYKQMHYK